MGLGHRSLPNHHLGGLSLLDPSPTTTHKHVAPPKPNPFLPPCPLPPCPPPSALELQQFGGGERYLLSVVAVMQGMGYAVDVMVAASNACKTKQQLLHVASGLRVDLKPDRVSLLPVTTRKGGFIDVRGGVGGRGWGQGVEGALPSEEWQQAAN